MKQQYNVGDMFVVYHGKTYTRAILTQIYKAGTYSEYVVCWFDRNTLGDYRKTSYTYFEIKTQIDRCAWEHHKVGK
jgi:hypothetical protein